MGDEFSLNFNEQGNCRYDIVGTSKCSGQSNKFFDNLSRTGRKGSQKVENRTTVACKELTEEKRWKEAKHTEMKKNSILSHTQTKQNT